MTLSDSVVYFLLLLLAGLCEGGLRHRHRESHTGVVRFPLSEDEPEKRNEPIPTEDETIPTENETIPTEDETIPTENETIPTENETIPTEEIPPRNPQLVEADSTVVSDTKWTQLSSEYWREEEIDPILNFRCFRSYVGDDERGMPIDVHRISIEPKEEGFEIDNFGVPDCTPMLTRPLQYSLTSTRRQDGFEYTITFRDANEECYRRDYVTKHKEYTTRLVRSDAVKIECTEEVERGKVTFKVSKLGQVPKYDWNHDESTVSQDLPIKHVLRVNIPGEFEKDDSLFDITHQISDMSVPGECRQIRVYCNQHKVFTSKTDSVLVTDVIAEADDKTRLERVLVSSCDKSGLSASFKCIKHECDIHICMYTIIYQNEIGVCRQRSYKTTRDFDRELRNIRQIVVDKYDTITVDCPLDMVFQANVHVTRKKITGWINKAIRGINARVVEPHRPSRAHKS